MTPADFGRKTGLRPWVYRALLLAGRRIGHHRGHPFVLPEDPMDRHTRSTGQLQSGRRWFRPFVLPEDPMDRHTLPPDVVARIKAIGQGVDGRNAALLLEFVRPRLDPDHHIRLADRTALALHRRLEESRRAP